MPGCMGLRVMDREKLAPKSGDGLLSSVLADTPRALGSLGRRCSTPRSGRTLRNCNVASLDSPHDVFVDLSSQQMQTKASTLVPRHVPVAPTAGQRQSLLAPTAGQRHVG